MVPPFICGKYFSLQLSDVSFCVYMFAMVSFPFFSEHRLCRFLLFMEVLWCQRNKDCVYMCVWWGECMAWHKVRLLGQKYISAIGRAGSVSTTRNFMPLIRAIGAWAASLLGWSIWQTALSCGLCLANGGLKCKCCKEALWRDLGKICLIYGWAHPPRLGSTGSAALSHWEQLWGLNNYGWNWAALRCHFTSLQIVCAQ